MENPLLVLQLAPTNVEKVLFARLLPSSHRLSRLVPLQPLVQFGFFSFLSFFLGKINFVYLSTPAY